MKKLILVNTLIMIVISLIACSALVDSETVHIEDKELLAAIKEKLESEGSEFTEETVANISELRADNRNISSLEGIQQLQKLEILSIQGNNISNLSPLIELDHLKALNILNNSLNLEEGSDDYDVIQQLINRGVIVQYEGLQIVQNEQLQQKQDASESSKSNNSDNDNVGSKGIFYEIRHSDTTIYLFGSVHVGREDMYPLHPKVEEAFNTADYLAVEVNINQTSQLDALKHVLTGGMYLDGTTVQDHLSEDVFRQLEDALEPHGLNNQMTYLFTPFMLAEMINLQNYLAMGFTAEEGIDKYFLDRAENSKQVIELESLSSQMELFSHLSNEAQIEYLEHTLNQLESIEDDMNELIHIWKSGDIQSLAQMRTEESIDNEEYREFRRKLTDERDEAMAKKIAEYLEGGRQETYFVVVGALHLVGENSIVDRLQNKGYDVQEVF